MGPSSIYSIRQLYFLLGNRILKHTDITSASVKKGFLKKILIFKELVIDFVMTREVLKLYISGLVIFDSRSLLIQLIIQ